MKCTMRGYISRYYCFIEDVKAAIAWCIIKICKIIIEAISK